MRHRHRYGNINDFNLIMRISIVMEYANFGDLFIQICDHQKN